MPEATEIACKPSIVMPAPEVRSIIAGRKTQFRRLCEEAWDRHDGPAASVHPDGAGKGWIAWWPNPVSAAQTVKFYPGDEGFRCPFGLPGDRLYVQEPWVRRHLTGGGAVASETPQPAESMPEWASRITLEVVRIRVERVQSITEEDAKAEGTRIEYLPPDPDNFHRPGSYGYVPDLGPEETIQHTRREAYAVLWDHISGKGSWAANPWAWVVAFEPVKLPEDHRSGRPSAAGRQ